MEMYCVRYFLAVAETLNFTRAAEQCRVRQPSLTRAIKKLEEELGGDLFYRERSHTHLTELGRSMLPLLKQCYASAVAAEALAARHKRGQYTTLRLAISHTVTMDLLAGHLRELGRVVPEMELEYYRGTAAEIIEYLKDGEVELAIAGPLGDDWNRLDSWSLFNEEVVLAVSECHPYANRDCIELSLLSDIPIMIRPYCENFSDTLDLFNKLGITLQEAQLVRQDSDLVPLIKVGIGACLIPQSLGVRQGLRMIRINNVDLRRNVFLYSVAGRKRTVAGAALIGLLCSEDWGEAPGNCPKRERFLYKSENLVLEKSSSPDNNIEIPKKDVPI